MLRFNSTVGPEEAAISFADSYVKLSKWVDRLRSELPLADAIDIVSGRIAETDGEDNEILVELLERLLLESGRYREALQILDEIIEKDLDDVRPLIRKATVYLYDVENFKEALNSIDLALQRAYRTLFFRREALGVKARILLQLSQGEQFSHVLEEIMSLRILKDISDVGRERDFVDRAPSGFISKDLLARYNQFRPKRAGDTTFNEPPEYEPPEEWELDK